MGYQSWLVWRQTSPNPPDGEASVHHPKDEHRRAMVAAMAARLSRVRGAMTDAEFGQLLADVVKVAERFVEIDAKPGASRANMPPEEIRRLLDITPG